MTVKSCYKCLPWLRKLSKTKGVKSRRLLLSSAPKKLLKVIKEIIVNILNGKIKLQKKTRKFLSRYKNIMRDFASNKRRSIIKQKKIIIQKGGFLHKLLIPVISLLASKVADKLMK